MTGCASRRTRDTQLIENGRFISRRVLREAWLCAVRVGNRDIERFCEVILSLYALGVRSEEPELIPHELRDVMVVVDHLCMLELHKCMHESMFLLTLGQFGKEGCMFEIHKW